MDSHVDLEWLVSRLARLGSFLNRSIAHDAVSPGPVNVFTAGAIQRLPPAICHPRRLLGVFAAETPTTQVAPRVGGLREHGGLRYNLPACNKLGWTGMEWPSGVTGRERYLAQFAGRRKPLVSFHCNLQNKSSTDNVNTQVGLSSYVTQKSPATLEMETEDCRSLWKWKGYKT